MAIGFLSALATTLVWIIIHLIHMHLRPTKDRMKFMWRGFLLSLPLLFLATGLQWAVPGWREFLAGSEAAWLAYAMAAILHLLFFFCFVECFYHVERAVTLRILIEIQDHPDGAAQLDELTQLYPVADMIERRLEDLRRNNFITKRDGRWALAAKGRLFASVMSVSNRIFNSRPQNERED